MSIKSGPGPGRGRGRGPEPSSRLDDCAAG